MCVFHQHMFEIVVTINEGIKMLPTYACMLTWLYEKLKQVQYDTQLFISE